jgi:hypothetical protein
MDAEIFKYLKSLPAVLGIAGFFAYLWVGQTRIGADIIKEIIKKLRADPNLGIKDYGKLTPAKIEKLIQSDENIRKAINTEDARLLGRLAVLQYLLTALVLIVCALLIASSIWLYTRPEGLSVISAGAKPVAKEAGDLLVDLDPIRVEWTCTGKEEMVSAYLENVDSQAHCPKRTVASNVRSVVFDPSDVRAVATDRGFHGKNRIRSVIEWPGGRSESDPKEMKVGIEVELRFNGTLLASDGTKRAINTLLATIDRSTENLPHDYEFKGDFVASTTNVPMVVPLTGKNSEGEINIPNLEAVVWTKPTGFVYGGPDDPRIVRSHVYH